MATNTSSGSIKTSKRRHMSSSSDEEVSSFVKDYWPRFLVIECADGSPLNINPFAVSKGIQGVCGDVKNVTRLRNGSLLIECVRRQQSVNLLALKHFVNKQVVVSEHKTLNSCRGIVRDRARCLSDMTEEEIVAELKEQGVTSVTRFIKKQESTSIKTNTYLFTFGLSTPPKFLKAGYCNIGVEVYVPNPLRCYKCQKFGHGAKSCTCKSVCSRCSGAHESTECTNDIKCANCSGEHLASSKACPKFEYETKILKLKCTNHISYFEAKKLVQAQSRPVTGISYSATVSSPTPSSVKKASTASTSCQTVISWINDTQLTFDDTTQSSQGGGSWANPVELFLCDYSARVYHSSILGAVSRRPTGL